MKQFAVLVCLVGLSLAELNCEDCSKMGASFSALASSEDAIKVQIEEITGPVCDGVEPELMCEENLPAFWTAINAAIFNAETGWFAPANLCEDVCAAKSLGRDLMCADCEERINASMDFFGSEDVQVQVIEALQGSGFCDAFPDTEECELGLRIVIPPAFNVFATADRSWIPQQCTMVPCM